MTDPSPLAVFYEHPDWFRPLFAELDRRAIPYQRLHAARHWFDPADRVPPARIVFNRMSPSAHLRGHGRAIGYTTQYLNHLEALGTRVINGPRAWRTEISKAAQLDLLDALDLPHPLTRVLHDPGALPDAAHGLRFPVVLKPNVGGSGAGIRRYDSIDALRESARAGSLDFGLDGTALLQEFIPARGGTITRVEVLDGAFLYGIRVTADGETFNLCPADVCLTADGAELARAACPVDAPRNGLRVESCTPPPAVVGAVERIAAVAGIEVGGIEYTIDDRDGRLYYYDVNALSNFVADAPRVVGFDAFARLVDWLETLIAAPAALAGEA